MLFAGEERRQGKTINVADSNFGLFTCYNAILNEQFYITSHT